MNYMDGQPDTTGLEIAVIGMAVRFPDADNIDEFWTNIHQGVHSVRFFTDDQLLEKGVPTEILERPDFVKTNGAALDGKELFDASFFGYIPDEAREMDPQVRIFHEVVWHALESAAYDPFTYKGLIGLYAGASPNFYWEALAKVASGETSTSRLGANYVVDKDFLSTRISYNLNLRGPSLNVQTACSTGLVAIHLACQSLLSGECDMALAGGVGISTKITAGYIYQKGMISSPDGLCRSFDAASNGTTAGEGAGVVLLKPLEEALEGRDVIHAIIKGSALNNDGKSKVGYSAPSTAGQAGVIRSAYKAAAVDPATISYIEAHGSGTSLGDPIEVEALKLAFGPLEIGSIGIGSVKTNIGHLDAAAGIAGFIKTALALKHRTIPASLHFVTPNPNIDFDNTPFYVTAEPVTLSEGKFPLRAGVSSFGIGGTNAHFVLEEAPEFCGRYLEPQRPQLIVLSAKTPEALEIKSKDLKIYLQTHKDIHLADLAYTLQVGRSSFNVRCHVVVDTIEDLTRQLADGTLAGECEPLGEAQAVMEPEYWISHLLELERQVGEDVDSLMRNCWNMIGLLWNQGADIDWQRIYTDKTRSRLPLPGYPFQRQDFSIPDRLHRRLLDGDTRVTQRDATPQKRANIDDWFYTSIWRQTPLLAPDEIIAPKGVIYLLFMDRQGFGKRIQQELKQRGATVVTVSEGSDYSKDGAESYVIDPTRATSYQSLVKDLKEEDRLPERVIHIWSLDGCDSQSGFMSLLFWVQAMGDANSRKQVKVIVVTNQMQDVTGEETLDPMQSTVLGAVRVIGQENLHIDCMSLDIQLPTATPSLLRVWAARCVAELESPESAMHVAYRGRHRWAQSIEALVPWNSCESTSKLRTNGVYLVTGGLGYVGMRITNYLAQRTNGTLILTGRSPLNDIAARKIQDLKNAGVEAVYFAVDVADENGMRQMVAEIQEAYGKIHGVVHAAGIPGGKVFKGIKDIVSEDVDIQFRAKVIGPQVLGHVFREIDLDFCLLSSSIATVLGALGNSIYTSANCFIDAFAALRNNIMPEQAWTSVDWDHWNDMDESEGFGLLDRIFSMPLPSRLVVSPLAIEARMRQWDKTSISKDQDESDDESTTINLQPRPALSSPFVAPDTSLEQRLTEIWSRFFGISELGVEDDFFELGGDSLKAMTVLLKINRCFDVDIPLSDLFTFSTIRGLAGFIETADREESQSIPQVEKKEYYSMSSAQKRMFLLQELMPETLAYNEVSAVRLSGDFSHERFQRALKTIIQRHEIFRTSFIVVDGQPVQKILPEVDFTLEVIEDDQPVDELVERFVRPFDLSLPPHMRVGLIPQETGGHIVVLDIHHVISDGVSKGVFIDELTFLLNGESLPPLTLHYKDYAEWQQRGLGRRELQKQEKYWLKRFSGSIPVIQLPLDYPRPAVQDFAGNTIEFSIGSYETEELRRIGQQHSITLYMILLGIFSIFLSKLSRQEDIIVGTPTTGRGELDFAEIIGIFINTLCIRTIVEPGNTVINYLNHVKATTLQAFENQDYQFEDLVEQLSVSRDTGRNPLFDILFVFHNIDGPARNRYQQPDGGLVSSHVNVESKVSKFDLTLSGEERDRKIVLKFEYSTALFEENTIRRFIDYFLRTVSVVASQSHALISQIQLLDDEQRKQVLYNFNDTSGDLQNESTLWDLYLRRLTTTPDEIVMMDRQNSLTCKQFHGCVLHLSSELKERGFVPGMTAVIKAERSLRMVVGIYAIIASGGAYLPVDARIPSERLSFILKDSACSYLLTNPAEPNPNLPAVEIIDLSLDNKIRRLPEEPISPSGPGDPAYIIYTSGSTGIPKGVVVEHQSVVNILAHLQELYPLEEGDTYLLKTNVTFDVSVTELFSWIFGDGRLAIPQQGVEKDVEALIGFIRQHAVTHVNFVPSQLSVFIDALRDSVDLDAFPLKYIFAAGEAFVANHAKTLKEMGLTFQVENIYGPTEGAIYASGYSLSDFSGNHWVPIGKPLKNIHCYILDPVGQPLPVLVPGELYLGGRCVARGYLNRPQLTADCFVKPATGSGIDDERMYKTGDIARWLPDGNIQYLGRVDHQVKIRGFRIELGEIENRMTRHPLVQEAVVISRKDAAGDLFLCGFYTVSQLEGADRLSRETLLEFLGESLPDYMLPTHVLELSEFQRTSSGKLDRRALEIHPLPTYSSSARPVDALEERLLGLWAEVLGIDEQSLGRNTNFFQVGGHSLKMTQLLARISKTLDIKLSMMDAFHTPTVEGMAKLLRGKGLSGGKAIIPVKTRDHYPVSPSQRRLFILQQMDPAGTGYHMPSIVPLPQDADVPRIEAAFERLIERHESLRTSFHILSGNPVQRIHPQVAFRLEQHRLKEGTPVDGGMMKDFIRPFDLAIPPLFRVAVVNTSEGNYVLMDMHHIIGDGVSHDVLVKDFMSFYEGKDPVPIGIQYRDYCVWLQEEIRGGSLESQREFWLRQFDDGVPVLELPTDFPRPPLQSFAGGTLAFKLSQTETKDLYELARSHDATLYMTILAIYSLMLSRLSGQEDVVVGTPVAGRGNAALENIIGVFINMLPMHCRIPKNQTFKDYLEQIRELSLQAFDQQEYPFDLLVDHLDLQRDTSRNPVFDAVLMVQNYFRRHDNAEADGPLQVEHGTSKFDITLYIEEGDKRLSVAFEYCTQLFKDDTIERFAGYFQELVVSVCRRPEALMTTLSMIPEQERRQVLEEFNRSGGDFPRDVSVFDLFYRQVKEGPHRAALVFERQWFTYGGLLELASAMGETLERSGFCAGDIAAIMLERSAELIVAIMGVMAAGGTYLYIDPAYPERRKRFMLEDSAASVALCSGGEEIALPTACGKCPVEEALELRERGGWRPQAITPESIAYISYTSGSTGKPKGVMIRHRSVVNFIYAILANIPVTSEDRVLSLTTASFDIFVLETLLPLGSGARVVLGNRQEQLDIPLAAKTLARQGVTLLQLTPSRLQLWGSNQESALVLKRLNYLVAGGEAFPQTLADQVVKLTTAKTYNVYGPTETTVWSTICPVMPNSVLTIGTPLLNNRIYILNDKGMPQPIGVPGELYIAGDGLASGYVNRPELTAERFVYSRYISEEFLYRTGDLARWLSDGTIEFIGRIDNQVKLRGFRIELGEIQSCLTGHPEIREAVVLIKETEGGPALGAYLVADREFSVAQLRQFLAKSLPEYMIPAFFVTLAEIPLTPNGKTDTRRLRAMENRIGTGSDYIAPEAGMEQEIAAIWREILGVEKIGSHDNFFELGGNSMGLLQVSEKLSKLLRRQVPVVTLYRFMTVHTLAKSFSGEAGDAMRKYGVRDRKDEIDKGKARLKNRIKRKSR